MIDLRVDVQLKYASGFQLEAAFETRSLVTSLFGPSGSGKTTLLYAIAGLLPAARGTIRLGDTVLADTSSGVFLAPERRRVGLVFQDYLLFPHLSVEGNLRFGHRPGSSGPTLEKVAQVLELDSLLARRPGALSGGQKQRVALGRALLAAPRLLLLDEPFASLDEALRSRLLDYLERVVDEWRIPTIYVSHNQLEVRRLAERVIVLDAGRVVAEGPTSEILSAPTMLSKSGDAAPINLVHVRSIRLEGGEWIGKLGGQEIALPVPDAAAPGKVTEALVSFPPHAVGLALASPEGQSVRNRLGGVVRQVIPLTGRVMVGVDVGELIWSEITESARAELGLGVGSTVICLVKTRSLRVAPS